MAYRTRKGLEGPKIEKTKAQKYVTLTQLKQILTAVEESDNLKKVRDHCAIYLGYFLGLRVSEACLLERENFRHIESHEAHLRTKKNLPRLPVQCRACGRRWRVSVARIGQDVQCPRCGERRPVHKPERELDLNPPEKSPPIVESTVVEYIQKYMDQMRPEQRWFLESAPGRHAAPRTLEHIFGSYVVEAGLDPEYSFHSLRHGRGLLIYERFKDPVLLRDMLRQKTLSAAEWYMHLSPEKQREYLEVLDSISI